MGISQEKEKLYPLIFTGCAVKRTTENPFTTKATPSTNNIDATEDKGDQLIHKLWLNRIDSLYNMRVMNTSTKSHSAKTPEKFLQKSERRNNKMYLEACRQ